MQTDADDLDAAAMWSLADAIPVGGTAAVALIEHLWADPLSAAIGRAGGTLLEETWLARPEVESLDPRSHAKIVDHRPWLCPGAEDSRRIG